jgi:RimJ/RimL family protein N-acetyltransferase
MEIQVSKNTILKMFDLKFVQEFYNTIHNKIDLSDDYRTNYQRKYPTIEDLEKRFKDAIHNKFEKDGTPDFLIYKNNKIAGIFEFHPLSDENQIEIGYWLFKEFRQKGILSEIMPPMIKYTRDYFNFPKIVATTQEDNFASQALLRKFSFYRTGRVFDITEDNGDHTIEIEFDYVL